MLQRLLGTFSRRAKRTHLGHGSSAPDLESPGRKVSSCLDANLGTAQALRGRGEDVVIRQLRLGKDQRLRAFLLFVDGLVNKDMIARDIIDPLLRVTNPSMGKLSDLVRHGILAVPSLKEATIWSQVLAEVLIGETALFIDGEPHALVLETRSWQTRAVEAPNTEVTIRGPQEGFTESLRVNTSLLRRRIRNADLRLEAMVLGRRTGTKVCLAYIEKLPEDRVLQELRRRLERIDPAAVLESGQIEKLIEDCSWSPFSTVGATERPDVAALRLLQGRVAILCEGSPFVLTVPHLFMEMFQSAEDPYIRRIHAVTLRCGRFVAWLASLLSLSFYVALETFHQEMIPRPLIITMMAAREGTPFPVAVEVLLMGAAYEIVREAGSRLPRPVGQAISIVGTLIIGDAAVKAGLVAAQVIIVVAFSAVASFAAPALTQPSVLLRLLALIFTAIIGFYGTAIFFAGLLVHLASLRSFGVPYLSTFVPTAVETPRTMPSEPLPVWSILTCPEETAPRDPAGNRAGTDRGGSENGGNTTT